MTDNKYMSFRREKLFVFNKKYDSNQKYVYESMGNQGSEVKKLL